MRKFIAYVSFLLLILILATGRPVRPVTAHRSPGVPDGPSAPGFRFHEPVYELVEVPDDIPETTEALRALPLPALSPSDSSCRVVLHGRRGRVLRPDLRTVVLASAASESVSPSVATSEAPSTPGGDLTFTYDSPDLPWTAEEVSTLQSWVDSIYSALKALLGPPAFGNSTNIKKIPSGGSKGLYVPAQNEIFLVGLEFDTLAHEMAHAFHDDAIVFAAGYEEPIAQAAELEVCHQLGVAPSFDDHRSHDGSVYSEGYHRRGLARKLCASSLIYYQVGAYAWFKMHQESASVFTSFHSAYYAQFFSNPDLASDAPALQTLLVAAVPEVEGRPTAEWMESSWLFENAVGRSYELLSRTENMTIRYFLRDEYGQTSNLTNAPLQWTAYDCNGLILGAGTVSTNAWGWADLWPSSFPYTGRLKLHVQAVAPDGSIVQDVDWKWYDQSLLYTDHGLFGVVLGLQAGTITAWPAGAPDQAQSGPIANGQFDLKNLRTYRGKLQVSVQDEGGATVASRTVIKDSSSYFARVSLNSAPSQPTISGPTAPGYGETAEYSISGSDPDQDPMRYYVDWGDGATTTTDYVAGSLTLSHTWNGGLDCPVRVRALDVNERASPWSAILPVFAYEPPPAKPSTPQGPTQVNPETPTGYVSSSSDPYGQGVQLIFDWGDGSTIATGFNAPVSSEQIHSWAQTGTYVVRVRARDIQGAVSEWSDPLTVTVVPNVPPNTPTIVSSSMAGDPGQQLMITVQGTDPYGQPYDYIVDWGDGTTTTALRTSLYTDLYHAFSLPGTYSVKVMAKDIGGLSSAWSSSIGVGIRNFCSVKSISFTTSKSGKTWYLNIRVDVKDYTGKAVSYAKVYGKLKLPSGSILNASGTTNSYGYVVFKYGASVLPSGTYTFTVTNMTHGTMTYAASQNLETSDTYVKP